MPQQSPQWIDHEGHKILRMDVNGLPIEEYIAQINLALKMVVESKPEPDSVLLLCCGVQPQGHLDEAGAAWKVFQAGAKDLMKAQTVVGLTGFKRVVARLVVHNLYFASSEDDAKAWLIKQ